MNKKFSEVFKKYTPSEKLSKICSEADVTSVKIDKENNFLELSLSLENTFDKPLIYELEEEICSFYCFRYVRILTTYPKEKFSLDYVKNLIAEAERCGSVAKGFFNDFDASLDNGKLTVKIPFNTVGVEFLNFAKTSDFISNVIKKEFSLDYSVVIEKSDDGDEKYLEFFERKHNELLEGLSEIGKYEEPPISEDADSENIEEKPQYKRVKSIFDGSDTIERISENVFVSGKMTFDVSEMTALIGTHPDDEQKEKLLLSLIPLRNADRNYSNICVAGEVFFVDSQEVKRSGKNRITIGITDKDSSIFIKKLADPLVSEELLGIFKKGKSLLINGKITLDKFDNDYVLDYKNVFAVNRIRRTDKSENKRVELHLHTNMSAMDAIIKPDEIVNTAAAWGHKAVAITDHGNLQSFPIAMLTADKLGDKIKVIYGMEGYFVDDTQRASYKGDGITFSDEYVVFDIETTGLSASNCKIIEIGAVKYKEGIKLGEFSSFVNPFEKLSSEIVSLTGITDDMLKDAPDISAVLPDFLTFCGNDMLVAHNASFDIGFIRTACEKLSLSFDNPYLDTLSLSRYLNPSLKKHKLDNVVNYYKLGDFNHHRAIDDAAVLGLVFSKMISQLADEGINDISTMNYIMSEKSDPLKLKTYHQIILVKNQTGLKNLYRLVSMSYLDYFYKYPRIPKSVLQENREGLIIGSACEAGELFTAVVEGKPDDEIKEIASFYDYLEIQPLSNNEFMIDKGIVKSREELIAFNKKIIELGNELNIPVVATCDAHYLDPEDEIYRRIIMSIKSKDEEDRISKLYYRTTEEMLREFDYLDSDTARKIVIDNTNLIADSIEYVRPIPKGNYPPHIDGAEEELTEKCHSYAKELYGDPLPEEVSSRLERELDSIIKNGFAIMYIIARKLVENSEEKGYQVGSRGSVGSSFVATMAGITKVNPLPPHYRCRKCRHTEFVNDVSIGSGFDLPEKNCPECGTPMDRDGHNIPFETFLGFNGDKTPDIDLNFSGDVQADAHKFTEVLFGTGKAFKAGTISTLADKTAFGFTAKFLESKGVSVNRAEVQRLVDGCAGVKRTTGQHPGGIIVVPQEYEIYDFCPVQHPADDAGSDVITTHFEFKYLHDTILKLDILGHDIPTKYKRLEEFSNTSVLDVPMSDPNVYKLFTSPEPLGVTEEQIFSQTGTFGIPEMGTKFLRGVLIQAQPKCFMDLLQISGLSHGTGVWLDNAETLIKEGTCTIKDVIGCRDDIMMTLIQKYGIEKSLSFKIMEFVRKNKKGQVIPSDMQDVMREKGVPEWYIDSLQKIRYMFPKAHAAAYVMDALRLSWYKIYYPVAFYCAFFTAAPDGFDASVVMKGKEFVVYKIKELTALGQDMSATEKDILDALYLINECMQRGYEFLPINYFKSDAKKFLPENGAIRIPFSTFPGIGLSVAESITGARDKGEIYSLEDIKNKTLVSKSNLEVLEMNNVFDGLPKSDQLTMF